MAVGVAGLALGGVAEQPRDFRLTLDVGDLGEVQVAPVGLALAGKGILEIGVCLGSLQWLPLLLLPSTC